MDKIDKLIEEFEINSQGQREREFHNYSDNTEEELELLLKHHEEDLQEYIDRGDDEEDINHVREDIREIENELKGR